MIDFGKILKRAWHILLNYKILWVFGILLALTVGSSGSNPNYRYSINNGSNGSNGYQGVTPSTNPTMQELNQWFEQNIEPLATYPQQHIWTFVWIGLAFLLLILVIGVVVALIRYPAEAAVYRMVDSYEQSGEKVRFGAGWKLGWNHRAFRMWWINFLIQGLPGLVIFLLVIGLGVGIYFNVRNMVAGGNQGVAVAGIIASVIGFILIAFVFSLAAVFLRLLRQFFWRKVALEDTGTREAFRQGWAMFKHNWKNATLMWLIMVGIKIGFGIAGAILFFLLIPVYLVLFLPAVFAAAIPGLAVFGITSIFASWPIALILGLIVAVPVFFLVVLAPLTFINGWYLVYDSSAWTLAYREIKALGSVAPAEIQAPAK